MWSALRDRRLSRYKFRRRHPIGRYIVDLACTKYRLVIELDGGQHADNAMDMRRTAWLEAQGWGVIRFWNNDVLANTNGMVETIHRALLTRQTLTLPALRAGPALSRNASRCGRGTMRGEGPVSAGKFWIVSFVVSIIFLLLTRWLITNEYYFFAGYQVLQFIVLATAWNILGGYTGYTNFGTGAFFAVGAYTAVVLHKTTSLPVPAMMLIGGVMSGIVGFGMGYLTLRLKGVFFAIATLALAIVAQTLIVNWDYVGGSRGVYVIRPQQSPIYGSYIQYLYSLMLALTWISVAIAHTIERSTLGLGFNAIRDDEQAAEAGGVPTLRLKLISTTLSGALMGMSGAPLPYYVTYLDPASSFNLSYAVNSVAMPLIGGMTSWVGPIIGAVLLGTIQQLATVTISSALNLLIVGVLLIVFVVIAPNGIVGLVQARWRRRRR
jgi:branched-chain amino acid transport system permease protein